MPKTNGAGQATTLTPQQMSRLLDAAPTPEHRCLWAVMRFTGSRVTETLRLTWGALHTDRIVFVRSTTKTKTTREPMIGAALAAELAQYRQHWSERHGRPARAQDLVFPGRYGLLEPMTRQAADMALRQTLASIDPPLPSGIALHTFRRSLATTMAQAGASLVTVARFTGHASLEQLRRYIDVSPSDELAALDAIGGA
jgi:integrase